VAVTDLVPVTFTKWLPRSLEQRGEWYVKDELRRLYGDEHEGVDVTATPTDVKGEFRVSGLFPKSFADAREYK
jgi:hypothetical protein